MTFINLTSHPINEVTTGITVEPSGIIARCKSTTVKTGEHACVPLFETTFSGEIEGLPDPVEGTIYIVSALALNCAGGRTDVVSPGNLQRDQQGRPVGCFGFRR